MSLTQINAVNLCCSVNPLGQCKHCRAKICRDHLMDQFPRRDRWDCPTCKWVCIVYSYPLRTYEGWPKQLVEVDTAAHLYTYDPQYARNTVPYNG